MMRTAVQLRETRPSGRLLHGAPIDILPGPRGPIAVFEPGTLVVYFVDASYRPSLFVFRTLLVDDRLAASVPGVRPRVRLLLGLHRAGPIRRLRRLLTHLLEHGPDPDALTDAFWLRIGSALGGRCRPYGQLASFLRREPLPPCRTTTRTGAAP